MDPITMSIITGIASGVLANFSTDSVKHLFTTAFTAKPELKEKLKSAQTNTDIEAVFKDAVEVIDECAENGDITVDGGLLEAIRGIRFDHSHGTVNIAGTTIKSNVLVTGGSTEATGKTTIGENTEMKSQGTSIQLGKGCSIQMSGNSRIVQS